LKSQQRKVCPRRDERRVDIYLLFLSLQAKSSGGAGRKKLTAFNKFMVRAAPFYGNDFADCFVFSQRTEMERLKEDEPDITHKERYLFTFVDIVCVLI
jgi:hypothetical protein